MPQSVTWVRIGAGRVAHVLGEHGTDGRGTTKCGKVGKVTIFKDQTKLPNTCDRCLNITRVG